MAGFKTHITTSTVLGAGYAVGGYLLLDAPESTSLLAGAFCSVSGMLPDLDSDSGVPVREMTAFAAAVIPMLMMDHFRDMGWTPEMMVFVGGLIYVIIRFGVVEVFKKYTVHRGMWHSIPACAVVGLLAFLLVTGDDMTLRLFKTGGVVLGFLSHLVLDEIWSVDTSRGRVRIKKSFGTALKFWGRSWWGNVSVYGKLVILLFIVFGHPLQLSEQYGVPSLGLQRLARKMDENRMRRQAFSDNGPPPATKETTDPPPETPIERFLVPSPVNRF